MYNPSRLLPERGPARLLAAATFVASIAVSMYIAISALYFYRIVGLSPTQIGLGLTVAGLAALVLRVPFGQLADRVGPRDVMIGLELLQVVIIGAVPFVDSMAGYVVLATLLAVAEGGSNVARSALIAGMMGRAGRAKLSAYLRSVFNAGFMIGTAGGGLALALGSRTAYVSALLTTAVARAVVALVQLRLPRVAPSTREQLEGKRWAAVLDVPYLLVGQVSGLVTLSDRMLLVGMPLWLANNTAAPTATAAYLIALCAVVVTLLQVRFTRGADTVRGAVRLQRLSFVFLAVACGVLAAASGLGKWGAVVVLSVAVGFLALGEMWGAAASWGLRFELAPPALQGQYGGVFGLGQATPMIAGPLMVTALPEHLGPVGWLVVAAVFVLALGFTGPVTAWAQRTRPPESADEPMLARSDTF